MKTLQSRRQFWPALTLGLAAWFDVGVARPLEDDGPHVTLKRFLAAFNALDWQAFQDCLAEDVSPFNPDIPEAASLHRLDGRVEVESSFRKVFAVSRNAPGAAGPHIVPERTRVQQFGETAVATFEFQRSGSSFGRRTVVLNRGVTGWKIVHIHASNIG